MSADVIVPVHESVDMDVAWPEVMDTARQAFVDMGVAAEPHCVNVIDGDAAKIGDRWMDGYVLYLFRQERA